MEARHSRKSNFNDNRIYKRVFVKKKMLGLHLPCRCVMNSVRASSIDTMTRISAMNDRPFGTISGRPIRSRPRQQALPFIMLNSFEGMQRSFFNKPAILQKQASFTSGLSMTRQQIVAYCVTLDDESFDMQGSARALQLRFSTEPAIFLHEEVYYMQLPSNATVEGTMLTFDLFIFKDGSVVLWNAPARIEDAVLQFLEPFRTRREGDDVPAERETMSCAVDADLKEVSPTAAKRRAHSHFAPRAAQHRTDSAPAQAVPLPALMRPPVAASASTTARGPSCSSRAPA